MQIIKVARNSKENKFKTRVVDILVDDDDYPWLSQYNWSFKNGYASTKMGRRYVAMHRMIMGVMTKDPVLIDHIDNNPYNNQKYNLRKADRFQNQQNRKTNKGNTLPKGIRLLPSGRYNVRVQTYNSRVIIGTFDTEEEAIEARNRYAQEHHGEFFNPSYKINNEQSVSEIS